MNKPKIIVLADIASLKVTCAGFKEIIRGLEAKFDVVTCKFYSYVAKRNRDFNEYISANGYETELPSDSRRRNKLDSRQVMDCVGISDLAKIDAVALMSGEGDILPVINLLKSKGKEVYDINVEQSEYSYAFSGFIPVAPGYLRDGYTAPATKKALKKPPKVVASAPRADDTARRESATTTEAKRALTGAEILAKYKK